MGKNIAVMFGEPTPEIIKLLKSRLDDYTFEMFKDVRDFVARSGQQRNQFNRLIISPASLNSVEDLYMLEEFVSTIAVRTSVVILLKINQSQEYHKAFHENFSSPLYTDMAVHSATDVEIIKAVTEEIEDLRKEYSAFKIEDVSVLEDSIEVEDKTSPFSDNFIVQRPMSKIPRVRPFGFLDKLANKPIKYSEKESKILQTNNTSMKEFMNVLGNKGYSKFRRMFKDNKREIYAKNGLMKIPSTPETGEKKLVKPSLYRTDFEQSLLSLKAFNKDLNLKASKFVNRTGRPIQNS